MPVYLQPDRSFPSRLLVHLASHLVHPVRPYRSVLDRIRLFIGLFTRSFNPDRHSSRLFPRQDSMVRLPQMGEMVSSELVTETSFTLPFTHPLPYCIPYPTMDKAYNCQTTDQRCKSESRISDLRKVPFRFEL